MTDVRVEVRIARPQREVAAYMFDPANDTAWTHGVVEVHPRQPGRLRSGARVERVSRFLGRRFAYEYEVTAADGDHRVEMRVERPFPMRIRYELEAAPGGTVARIHARGEPRGFFRVGGPLLELMVRRSIRRDLETLRERVEGMPAA